jgi:hypothetical protein
VVVDGLNSSVVYAGLEGGGVYRSQTAGASWEPFDSGLPAGSNVRSLAVTLGTTGCTRLYAGTVAGDVWAWR